MRIVVLSDTHLQEPDQDLIQVQESILEDADAVLHCGDITGYDVWSCLSSHPRFYAVRGNMDMGTWAQELPQIRLLELWGLRVGLMHGHGVQLDQEALLRCFQQEPDLVCFGHTHRRYWAQGPAEVRFLNPGSFSLPKGSRPGFALLQGQSRQNLELQWMDIDARR
ncbi:MAG: metallophosphoesterase family protein [Desulfohalobiaceae bacterium]